MKEYGCRVYPRGHELHTDGGHRKRDRLGIVHFKPLFPTSGGPRGAIAGFTKESRRRLGWTLANATASFAVHATLTYHARVDETNGDQVAARNRTLVGRAKLDLNRMFASVRHEIRACDRTHECQERWRERGVGCMRLLGSVEGESLPNGQEGVEGWSRRRPLALGARYFRYTNLDTARSPACDSSSR